MESDCGFRSRQCRVYLSERVPEKSRVVGKESPLRLSPAVSLMSPASRVNHPRPCAERLQTLMRVDYALHYEVFALLYKHLFKKKVP